MDAENLKHVVLIGGLGAVSLDSGITALYLSVSFIQMLAAVPAVTFFVMTTAGLKVAWMTPGEVATLGTFIAVYGEVKFSAIGVMMMLTPSRGSDQDGVFPYAGEFKL